MNDRKALPRWKQALYHGAMKYARSGFPGKTVFLSAAFIAFFSTLVLAQVEPPYLKSATLYLAADGWVDIWLNGVPIRESQPSTPESKGFQTIQCLPGHLCYFQNENVIAIENANAFREPSPLNHQIGLAYVLRLRFSDGSERTFSSNDLQDHRAYYISDRKAEEPFHWQSMSFDDAGWSSPFSLGTTIPGVARLSDSAAGQAISFLGSSGATFEVRASGERHLYRREFSLNIRPNPRCSGQGIQPLERPMRTIRLVRRPSSVAIQPTVPESQLVHTPTPLDGQSGENRTQDIHPYAKPPRGLVAVFPTPTDTPILVIERIWNAPVFAPPTATPLPAEVPKPALVWTLPPTPVPTVIWAPPPTWTPVWPPPIVPVPTRSIHPTPVLRKNPSIPPTPIRKIRLRKPTPTPVPDFGIPNRAEPFESKAPLIPTKPPTPVPPPNASQQPTSDGAQTIVFEDQPANIYISYADGPGIYRLEVVDASLHPIRALFEKHVVAQQDDWVEWDGKDDAGREMPTGQYTVLYTKDGMELNKLILVKTAAH